jgi:hypothetical protein
MKNWIIKLLGGYTSEEYEAMLEYKNPVMKLKDFLIGHPLAAHIFEREQLENRLVKK